LDSVHGWFIQDTGSKDTESEDTQSKQEDGSSSKKIRKIKKVSSFYTT
jgi:hypothetical protein